MQQHDQHVSPIKNWKQLVVVVVLAFVVPIALAVLISQWVTSGSKGMHEDESAIIKRIQPVGEVVARAAERPERTAHRRAGVWTSLQDLPRRRSRGGAEVRRRGSLGEGDRAGTGGDGRSCAQGNPRDAGEGRKSGSRQRRGRARRRLHGEQVRREVERAHGASRGSRRASAAASKSCSVTCGKCHQTGEGGAPKIGDRAAWRERAKKGYKVVLQSALKGHAGMPARGGMAELSDVEIGRAVQYMMNSGAEQPVTAAAPAAGAAAPAAAAATKADGKKVFETTCVVCHGTGVAGAPKFGDKAAWAPRIKTGIDTLYKVALTGKGAMPPRGGNKDLPDADVKAAVDYMVAAAK